VAELGQIRNFYKDQRVYCGRVAIDALDDEAQRKIERQVINSRGEIFFSKLMVLFEGETEEQALPIFAKHHFGQSGFEMGIDFVGVGGYGNYLPFLRFAESLNIPWLILSDAETDAETDAVTSVKRQFNDSGSLKVEADVIVFLDNGNDIEKQLIKDGYQDEIKKALIARGEYHNEQHKVKKETEIKAYGDDKIYELITGAKTQFAPVIAEQIVKSDKALN
jgi:putative ATP-dependent endonuclease of OLD family